MPQPPESGPPSWSEWLEKRIEARRTRFPDAPAPHQFSVITPAFNTPPALLRECAESILGQLDGRNVEWILVDNGSATPGTIALLDELGARTGVHLVRLPHNVGIQQALRIALERASGRYVVPVDSDDLLTLDCMRVLATSVRELDEPAYIFSDEDLLIEGVPRHPYLRPDFDPVLNLASSYIWHATAIRRDVALACDLYRDVHAAYCTDWDSVMRIWQAGHKLAHVPEILYHWRQHPQSSTNKADPVAGSIASVRHVLDRFVAAQPRPELYRVEDFPIFRGARELYILRNEFHAEPLDLLVAGGDPACIRRLLDSVLEAWRFPIREICVWSREPVSETAAQAFHGVLEAAASRAGVSTRPRLFHSCPLSVAVEGLPSPTCVVLSQHVLAQGGRTPWEALKHFEIFRDLVAIGGRIMDGAHLVQEAGAVGTADGRPHAVFAGLHANHPGPFALALKPQTLDQPSLDAFFVRREFLLRSVTGNADIATAGAIAAAVGQHAMASGSRVAMSPLVEFRLQEGRDPQRATLPGAVTRVQRRSGVMSEWGFAAAAGQYA